MEEQTKQDTKQEAKGKVKFVREEKKYASLVRILQTDIPGNKKILVGLTYIKGVSWSISNAVCKILKIDPNKKIENLDKQEIDKIENFLKNPKLPLFLMNRRNDFETGNNMHLITTQLDITKEFDIRRLKKIRSYRGYRHALGQPTRGQRTRSHFRSKKKGKSVGVTKKKTEAAAPAAKESKGK
ncbi:MAG: 30S ribosomal protein S13 [Candidatus Nanoarchaeia archaeon]|nr:30S ribosomal protein S13 [Candidatus Nanoarchaeia archaeon]